MRKLIIQIPCLNEAETLPETYADLPKSVPGFDVVEVMVLDDGSIDNTVEIARQIGVNHIVRMPQNVGLARVFSIGVETAYRLGAAVLVNTDGDNQYQAKYIPDLVRPIVEDGYDMVIGTRPFDKIDTFSPLKKFLQRSGTWVVQQLAGVRVGDATSGFRALSREAMVRLNVLSNFSYTLETIIQASNVGLSVTTVPIETNRPTRPSRLFRSIPEFVSKSVGIILRVYLRYQPLRVFMTITLIASLIGLIPWVRFMYFYLSPPHGSTGHTQSLILGTIFLVFAMFTFVLGLISDLLQTNRQLMEQTLIHLRRLESGQPIAWLETPPPTQPDAPPRTPTD